MKLNKEHREALIAKLNNANERLIQHRKNWELRIKNTQSTNDTFEWHESWMEIDQFLTKMEIEIIEKALIENDIDF